MVTCPSVALGVCSRAPHVRVAVDFSRLRREHSRVAWSLRPIVLEHTGPLGAVRLACLVLACACQVHGLSAVSSSLALRPAPEAFSQTPVNGQCVDFSPYVSGYDPDTGPHPPPAVIDELLDLLVARTGTRCIVSYGVLNGLDHTIVAANQRGLSVVEIIYLDTDLAVNTASVAAGSLLARQYPQTVTRVSCGSEVAVRHGLASADPIVASCVNQLRSDGVVQPITSIDTWWEWCNEQWPCQVRGLASSLDWIGVNVFPWWENKYSGLFPCTSAAAAADFNVARLQDVAARYPAKPTMLTEFGWPAGPDGYTESNQFFPAQHCGVASESNQQLVIAATLAKLNQLGLSGSAFEAFREVWKASHEGPVGPFWGFVPHDVFTDEPMVPGTPIRSVHVAELRLRIDLLRIHFGLQPYGWSDPGPLASLVVRAVHLAELRSALQAAFSAAAVASPSFADPTLLPGVTAIKAVHVAELRAAVLALEQH